mgnify:CR=1 FL=1
MEYVKIVNQKNKFKEEFIMDLKGTKTEKNLMEAFAGESQARNKYTYFAAKAKKEGYEQIAAIFQESFFYSKKVKSKKKNMQKCGLNYYKVEK